MRVTHLTTIVIGLKSQFPSPKFDPAERSALSPSVVNSRFARLTTEGLVVGQTMFILEFSQLPTKMTYP